MVFRAADKEAVREGFPEHGGNQAEQLVAAGASLLFDTPAELTAFILNA